MKKYMFTATWCGNCELMKPIVSKISDVEIIDAEEKTELVEKYTIMGLPAYIVDDDGEIKFKTGILPEKIIKEFYSG